MVETTTIRNETRPNMKSGTESASDTLAVGNRTPGSEQRNMGGDRQTDMSASRGSASNDDMTGSYDTLKRDFDKLREDMTALAKSFTENQQHVVKRFTNDLVKEGQNLLTTARSRGETMVKSASDSSKQAATQFEGRIRERPFMSMLVSFLTGLIIARLMSKQ